MARKEICMEEVVEVIYQWHKGRNISQIKRSVGLDRKTIRKYLALAERCGFNRDMGSQPYEYYLELAGKIHKEVRTPLDPSPSYKKTLEYQSTIERLKDKPYMKPKQMYRILKREYGYPLSYPSFTRYMHLKYPQAPRSCLRLEVGPGEEAQVDFGSAGLLRDPETGTLRRAHLFVMTLSYSRLPYVEFVFDQGQKTWVQCHIHAFEFFGGVPARVILDNLKSGILRPNTYDPVFNRAYAECAKHYGFIIDPAKIRQAAHKGKVERTIPVVREQVLAGADFRDLREANSTVMAWCLEDYGMAIHGTTKRAPSDLFTTEEQQHLKALPGERFDLPLWKKAKVHPDHHIVFDQSFYSLPTRFVGKDVWVRGGLHVVHIFSEGELIKTHQKATRPGMRRTDEGDYPPEQSRYLLKTRGYDRQEALKYGEATGKLVDQIMTEHAYRNLRKVQALFRLAGKYGKEALDLTCRRCLFYEDDRMSTIKRVLDKKLYLLPLDEGHPHDPPKALHQLSFLRPAEYFTHSKEEQKHESQWTGLSQTETVTPHRNA